VILARLDRLAETLSDATDRESLGHAGRAYVEREHAATVIAARLVDLYREIGAREGVT